MEERFPSLETSKVDPGQCHGPPGYSWARCDVNATSDAGVACLVRIYDDFALLHRSILKLCCPPSSMASFANQRKPAAELLRRNLVQRDHPRNGQDSCLNTARIDWASRKRFDLI